MNLKKIINEMQKLNSEQEYIKDKYSINGKKINVFRGDIKQDLSHDLKIFGYTHQQAVNQIKKMKKTRNTRNTDDDEIQTKKRKQSFGGSKTEKYDKRETTLANDLKKMMQKRGKTAFIRGESQDDRQRNKFSQIVQKKQSVKNLNYSNKLYCLTAHLNHKDKKSQASTVKFRQLQNSEYISSFNVQKIQSKNRKICKKSIGHYKKNFSQNFSSNVTFMKYLNKSSMQAKIKNRKTIVCNKQNIKKQMNKCFSAHQRQRQKDPDDCFLLTQQNTKNEEVKEITDKMKWLKNLSYLLCDQFQFKPFLEERKMNIEKWKPVWEYVYHYRQFTVFIIEMSSLKCYQYEKDSFYKIEKEINLIIDKGQSVHFGLYCKKKQQLMYEEFIFLKKVGLDIKKQQLYIFQYYIKRFLCLDSTFQDIESILLHSFSFIKDQIKIPNQFEDFIFSMPFKECIIYNSKKNIIKLKLRDVLARGLKVLKNNKRALKWDVRKPVLISKYASKKEKKKEYFYI